MTGSHHAEFGDIMLAVAGWVLFAVYVVHIVPILWRIVRPVRLPEPTPRDDWLELTVVMAARNESAAVGKALESLLALDYPNLRVVAVDDRSDDGTGAIMDRLAAQDARLEVVHVQKLPAGWLGKNHANFVGAGRTDSPWILFTDGDVIFERGMLKRAIAHVLELRVDHLTMVPELIPGGLLENAMVCTFGLMFNFRFKPWLARLRCKWFYVGVGAFNLVSRAAYETIGTHRRLAMEVADDLKLGKLIKQHGLRQDVAAGRGELRIRWQIGLRGIVHGLTKNAFAGLEFSLPLTIAASLMFIAVFLAPYVLAVALPTPACWGFVAAVVLLEFGFACSAWAEGFNPLLAVLLPAMLCVFLYIIWRSTVITLRQGGVVWRDTFYSLEELRKGVV